MLHGRSACLIVRRVDWWFAKNGLITETTSKCFEELGGVQKVLKVRVLERFEGC